MRLQASRSNGAASIRAFASQAPSHLELVADGWLLAGGADARARGLLKVVEQLVHKIAALLDAGLQVLARGMRSAAK